VEILVFVTFSKEEDLQYFFCMSHIFKIIFQNSQGISEGIHSLISYVSYTVNKYVVFVFYMAKINIKLWFTCIVRVIVMSAEFISWIIYIKFYFTETERRGTQKLSNKYVHINKNYILQQ
jgi:hypothetical protein